MTKNLLVAFFLSSALPAAADTLNIVSQGVSVNELKNMDLGANVTAQTFQVRFVQTQTGGDAAGQTWSGDCLGSAEVIGDGYADTFLCVTWVTQTDSFITRNAFNTDGWDWTVIDGTGQFAGATGSGHITMGWGDERLGDRLTWTSAGTITTP